MKSPYIRYFVCIFFILSNYVVLAQSDIFLKDAKNLHYQYKKTNRTGMWVLGSWAIGNMLVSGAVLAFAKPQGESNYFYQMNIMWNTVNLGLAGLGLYQNYQSDEIISWQSVLNEHHQMQKILLFNAGLDVGYIMTGFFLKEKAKTAQNLPARLQGWGKSLILQGAFLLAFDVGLTIAHSKNGSKIQKFLENIQLKSTENGVGLIYFLH